MSKIELSNRLYEIMDTINHYEVMDTDYTPGQAYSDIVNNPYEIIKGLMDIIEGLTD